MKTLISAILIVLPLATVSHAGSVNGYYRSNGTYVAPHYQSRSNGTVTDNYSFSGNTNPYTGRTGTNRYSHDTTSPYYNGTPYSNGTYGHSTPRY